MITMVFAHNMPKKNSIKRVPTNITLTELAKKNGMELAELRGMSFAQLLEQLLREELAKAGKIPTSGK